MRTEPRRTLRPHRMIHRFVLAVVLSLGSIDIAHAKDLCCTAPNLAPLVFVFPKFKQPGPGRCGPASGYLSPDQLVGNVCTLTDGSAFRIAFSDISVFANTQIDLTVGQGFIAVGIPSLTGVYGENVLFTSPVSPISEGGAIACTECKSTDYPIQ